MTMKRIAELANVSIATVSKVINGKDRSISDETRKRILDIVEEEGYIPNRIAQSLKMDETKTLGMIIPDVTNPFFPEIIQGVEDLAEERGYSLFLCTTGNDSEREKKYIDMLESNRVDGIILTASENSDIRASINTKVPLIFLDRELGSSKRTGKIIVDNEEASYKATEHLIDQGSKKLGFIGSKVTTSLSKDRLRGFKKALKDSKLPWEENDIYLEEFTVKTGYLGAQKLLEDKKIDGLVCANDLIAIGAIRAALNRDRKIPEDIKIIGFDDIELAKYIEPSLTTMRQPKYRLGKEAAKMVIDMIQDRDTSRKEILECKLVKRNST